MRGMVRQTRGGRRKAFVGCDRYSLPLSLFLSLAPSSLSLSPFQEQESLRDQVSLRPPALVDTLKKLFSRSYFFIAHGYNTHALTLLVNRER